MSEHIIDHMIGRTAFKIDRGIESLEFLFDDGTAVMMWNSETGTGNDVSVDLDDVCGDLDDLIGFPITVAEEASGGDDLPADQGGTWTFYRLATAKGFVTLRWLGRSNGYYSETVDINVGHIDVHSYPEYAEHIAKKQRVAIVDALAEDAYGVERPGKINKM